MKPTKPATTPKATPPSGPKPETLKLSGPWGDRVKDSLAKPRPPEGWPKPGK